MNILIVGNVLKDVYLNLDTRSDNFETDSSDTRWLNLSFNTSTHHFFGRSSNFGGAAVSLEVLSKMGVPSSISGSDFCFNDDGPVKSSPASTYRYILSADGGVTYFVPSEFSRTQFIAPTNDTPVDYLYLDRSADFGEETISRISAFLDSSPNTKLVVYLKNNENPALLGLAHRADLIFAENVTTLPDFPAEKVVFVSADQLSYLESHEKITIERIDTLTHLSVYSIMAGTILGGFVLGKTVEESLRLARVNIENSTLNSVLSLSELEAINENFNPEENLELIAANLVLPGKGILAADESGGSIEKKFAQLNIPDTFENRHDYRNLFFTTTDLERYVNGIILFDETARDFMDDGESIVDYLISHRIIPGIKVDQGLESWQGTEEKYTKGLDGLEDRLKEYYAMGLRFAKWRAAFNITDSTPSDECIAENCRILAEYAAKCQSAGLVPIVEPEVVYDGYYTLDRSVSVTGKILRALFTELSNWHVNLRACILKVNMVLAGKQYETGSTPEEVGRATAEVLKNYVPKDLAGVVFLSGGQTVEQATDNLAAVIKNGPFAWPVTFSFARALQDPALFTWQGNNDNAEEAKAAFKARLVANTDVLKV